MRKNLKDARKRLGLTQPQMAEMIGISTRGYQHMEQGIRIERALTDFKLHERFKPP